MASLEELLAEEGFRGRRSISRPTASIESRTVSMPLYPFRDKHKKISASGNRIKTERTRSDVTRYASRSELSASDSSGRRSRDNFVRREKTNARPEKEDKQGFEGGSSSDVPWDNRFIVNSSEDLPGNEIVEVSIEENEEIKGVYSNKMYSSERRRDRYSLEGGENERNSEKSGKDKKLYKSRHNSSNKNLLERTKFSDKNRKSMKQLETSYGRSSQGSWKSKPIEDNQTEKHDHIVPKVSEPALDEVAVQAIVSILSGYIKLFLKDEDFRTMLRRNCFSSINFVELEEGLNTENKVIASLEEAIAIIEKAALECASAKELKKASLQLSVITGLNSNDLKDGFTSGVSNSKLSACAHLYLSVVYKLHKKDRNSAKHLLRVFCNSPFQARTILLPELWDDLFFPHLSHLKVWYNQEVDSLAVADTPIRPRKLELLEKVYNEILDSGTYQFAVYYTNWLTEGVEAPSIPSVCIPSVSVHGVPLVGSIGHSLDVDSPAGPFSPQPMVSKKLYDAVFDRSRKPGVDEDEDDGEEEEYDNWLRSSDSSAVEVKQTLTYSLETTRPANQDIEDDRTKNNEDDAFLREDGLLLTDKEEWRLHEVSVPLESDLNDEVDNSKIWNESTGNAQLLYAPPLSKANELSLKRMAKTVFESQQAEASVDRTISTLSHSNEAVIPDSLANVQPIQISSSFEELHRSYEYYDERSFFSSIPQDFICPLTGQLFEDPVTLETGQTFERVAIREWFDQGNRTCPVTGKSLECQTVPLSNFVLKRVIDNWKSEHCRHLLAFASQIMGNSGGHGFKQKDEIAISILEQLLTAFSKEERITNAKHLISLGGLQFLLQRFEFGKLEEKTQVAALLSCCIEADAACRNQIARSINKQGLLELLQTKQIKSRTNAVMLLTELICLNRRTDVRLFLSGLQNEGIVNTMHVLLVYLQSSPPEQRPLVAVLLLHLDLLVEPRKYSIYREEAVDAITVALDGSLTNERVREQCCRALLILGGRFAFSGKLLTESWILKQAGFSNACEVNSLDNEEDGFQVDVTVLSDDEELAIGEWLRNLSASLLGNGTKSFLETISKCLGSGNLDLVRACLTTVTWLSCALSSLSDAEFQLSAFSALISRLKGILENGQQVEHKILASMSLLNFSKIPECRVLLMTIAEEITVPLRSLAEVTWTAKQLHAIISDEDL